MERGIIMLYEPINNYYTFKSVYLRRWSNIINYIYDVAHSSKQHISTKATLISNLVYKNTKHDNLMVKNKLNQNITRR